MSGAARGLAAGLLVLLASAVQAQAPAALSLADARRAAAEHNPAYRQTLNDLEVAAAAERQAWGGFLPQVSLSLGLSGYSSTTLTGQDDYGKPVSLPDPIEYQGSFSRQGASLSLPIFEGGERLARLRGSRADARGVRARAEAQRLTIEAELARAYYSALRYQRQAELEDSLLASAREQVEATRRLLAVAARDPLDLLGARVAEARQARALAEARGEARKALLRLQEQMGVSGGADYRLSDSLPAALDPMALDEAALVARALDAHPGLAQRHAAAEAAQAQLDVARAARWPRLSASLGYDRSVAMSGYRAMREWNPRNSSLSFGFSLSVPLFSSFQSSYRVAAARAAGEDAREEERAERLRLERAVREALIDLKSAHDGLTLAEQAAALAVDRVAMAREKYALGTLGFTELGQIVEQAAGAEREALAARYQMALARVALEQALGAPLPPGR